VDNLESLFLATEWLSAASTPAPMALLAYVGLGPGPEFIPYFAALLGLVGAALVAIFQWPLARLMALLRGKRRRDNGPESQTMTAETTEARRETDGGDGS